MSDAAHLREAIRLARTHSADGRHGPFGAVVVRDGGIVGRGWNQVVAENDPTAHAEVMAIRDAARRLETHDLSGCVLYTSCEPCPLCLSAAYWARIHRVVYAASKADAAVAGFDDADIYAELALPWEDRRVEGEQQLREEGVEVLRGWAANQDRVPY